MDKLALFAHILLAVSLFFWGWALQNTIGMGPGGWDWGLVSFFAVALSSTYLLAVAGSPHALSTRSKVMVTASHILVALNYLLGISYGISVAHSAATVTYCAIFTVLWIAAAVYGQKLMSDSNVGTTPTEISELL